MKGYECNNVEHMQKHMQKQVQQRAQEQVQQQVQLQQQVQQRTQQQVRIGLLGCGNVGAAFVTLLGEQRRQIALRTGIDLQIKRIAVRSPGKDRGISTDQSVFVTDMDVFATGTDQSVFVTDMESVVTDAEVDLIVEVVGGIEPVRGLLLQALRAGKPVVTANKEMLANHGGELFAAAHEAGVDLLFEAAVAGAIPLIRALRESLVGERVDRVMGIVNGTTNYILTRMAEHGTSYSDALQEAQTLGYAESDPTADVEGYDAGAKAALIATVAFGTVVLAEDVYHEGITHITPYDLEVAKRLGYTVKAVAVVERSSSTVSQEDKRVEGLHATVPHSEGLCTAAPCSEGSHAEDEIAVRVHPVMLPVQHPLASVRDSFNAVFVEGGSVGELMFYGRGAGGRPTAGAVLGDVVDAASNLVSSHAPCSVRHFENARIRSINKLRSAYYLAVEVVDRSGVLAAVADVFSRHQVSIRSMEQHRLGAQDAYLTFITHKCRESDLQATLRELDKLDVVLKIRTMIRVIQGERTL